LYVFAAGKTTMSASASRSLAAKVLAKAQDMPDPSIRAALLEIAQRLMERAVREEKQRKA
jgi:hypothetical protein